MAKIFNVEVLRVRQMKDSGVEWIGEIPQDWAKIRVKHAYNHHKYAVGEKSENYCRLALTLSGVIKRAKEDVKGLQPEVFGGYQILYKNELVFKLIDLENVATSRVGLSPYTGIVSPAYIVLRNKCIAVPKFGEYFFLSMWQRCIFNQMGDDGVRSSLNAGDLLNISYLCPSVEEQQKIANYLDEKCTEIDNAIAKTTASIEEYKKLKQSIITKAVTKGILGNRPMKDSGIEWIGEIPANWDVCFSSRFITSTQNGLTRRDSKDSQGNIVLKLKNISADGVINYHYKNRISLTDKELENYRLYPGDLLFVRVNGSKELVGKNAIYQDIGELVAYNDHIIRVRLDKKVCNEEYFHWFLMSNYGKCQIELHTATAAGQYTISSEGLKDIRVTVPSMSEQVEIISYLDKKTKNIDNIISRKQQLITELEAYKKSLIYEYVTGKKEVV